MTNEEIINGNKLIAEFMGIKDGDNKYSHESSEYYFEACELEYHYSWDWSMPVVEKIESLNHDVLIYNNHVCINTVRSWFDCNPEILGDRYIDIKEFEIHVEIGSKIEQVFSAVIEFIKWHNKRHLD